MERKIALAIINADYEVVNDMFGDGWILDPALYDGRPLRLSNSIVYHLIKYTPEEIKEMEEAAIQEPQPELTNMVSVAINDADPYLAKGYVKVQSFAKTVTLEKYKEVKADDT